MFGFIKKAFGDLFSSKPDEDELPDDGGLGDFARELAEELEAEARGGSRRGEVSAETVLSIQQGAKGASVYIVDISGFIAATVEELRDSVAPVTEGILKTKCGDKGKGYMRVGPIYVFNVHRNDPAEEYNAAMDIIDMIGVRLLGERYKTGKRKSLDVPVAKIVPDEIFKHDGTFDLSKANTALKFVREAGVKAPCEIDWEKGTAAPPKQARTWRENHIKQKKAPPANWQAHKSQKAPSAALGEWQKIHNKNPDDAPQKDWAAIEEQKKAGPEQGDWQTIEAEKSKKPAETEVPSPEQVAPPQKKKPAGVKAIDLKQLGVVFHAFRPTWSAREQKINVFNAHAYRKVSGIVQKGEQIYPEDLDLNQIFEIDQALAKQAADHIQNTPDLSEKCLIFPFHFKSMGVDQSDSPLACLYDLEEDLRQSIFIEMVGLGSNASPSRVSSAIEQAKSAFGKCGIRLELGDISKSLVERCQPEFISCDVAESTAHGIQMRGLNVELPEFTEVAKALHLESYIFGLAAKSDLLFALQEGGQFLNGPALAKETRTIGKTLQVSAQKLMAS